MKHKLLFLLFAALVLALSVGSTVIAADRDSVNLALVGVVSSLDPNTTALTVDLEVFHQIYEPLLYVDDYSEPHARVATDYTVSDDLSQRVRIEQHCEVIEGQFGGEQARICPGLGHGPEHHRYDRYEDHKDGECQYQFPGDCPHHDFSSLVNE